jgi:aminoglycoside phosphotransferase (APT) family kinase protein
MSLRDRPDEGQAWVPPHGHSQTVSWDGEAVVKAFGEDTAERASVERSLLALVAPEVPVPRLLPSADPSEVRMDFVRGILGQEWVAAMRPATNPERIARQATFMAHCGLVLRSIHEVDPAGALTTLPGDGPVVVHGDFAPYNVIVNPGDGRVVAVLDWELGHRGWPVEDLAWMEWNMRIWYSPQPSVLEAFYEAYGDLPAWSARHSFMMERCELHARRALRPSYPSVEARARWVEQLERTRWLEDIVSVG